MLDRKVVLFLGFVARYFASGSLTESGVENSDETHFIINSDDLKIPGFCIDSDVRYADLDSGCEGMTMIFPINGGINSITVPPFMICKNKGGNYPFIGVPDDVPGDCYTTAPKFWI